MKFQVDEWYVDAFCPSGENDFLVRREVIEAENEIEARRRYECSHSIDANNELRVYRMHQ